MHGRLVIRQYAVFVQRELLVHVEFRYLTEYLQSPHHDHHAENQVGRGEDLVQVAMTLLARIARHIVAKAHRTQRDEAVVECVQIRPVLDVGVYACRYYEEENEHDESTFEREYDVHVSALYAVKWQQRLDSLREYGKQIGGELHEAFDHGVQEEESGGYAD